MARNKTRYTIGELAEICGISAKTLRLYDEKGLLKPSERDDENNYRYYSEQQVLEALMIREMKLRGFTMSEMKTLLKSYDLVNLKDDLQKKMMAQKKELAQLEEQYKYTQNTYQLISHALQVYEESSANGEDNFKIAMMPRMTVLFTRYKCRVKADELFWDRYIELQKLREQLNVTAAGPFSAVFHDHYFNQFFFEQGDLEVFLPIQDNGLNSPHIKEYGGLLVASRVYVGRYADLLATYVELVKLIEKNHYRIIGPAIEEYLVEFSYGVSDNNCVTRVSFPVEQLLE